MTLRAQLMILAKATSCLQYRHHFTYEDHNTFIVKATEVTSSNMIRRPTCKEAVLLTKPWPIGGTSGSSKFDYQGQD
jgi:hypothetical protein